MRKFTNLNGMQKTGRKWKVSKGFGRLTKEQVDFIKEFLEDNPVNKLVVKVDSTHAMLVDVYNDHRITLSYNSIKLLKNLMLVEFFSENAKAEPETSGKDLCDAVNKEMAIKSFLEQKIKAFEQRIQTDALNVNIWKEALLEFN